MKQKRRMNRGEGDELSAWFRNLAQTACRDRRFS